MTPAYVKRKTVYEPHRICYKVWTFESIHATIFINLLVEIGLKSIQGTSKYLTKCRNNLYTLLILNLRVAETTAQKFKIRPTKY